MQQNSMTEDDVNALVGSIVIDVEDCTILELVTVRRFRGPPDWWTLQYRSDALDPDFPTGIPACLIGNSAHYVVASSVEEAKMRAPALHADYCAKQSRSPADNFVPF